MSKFLKSFVVLSFLFAPVPIFAQAKNIDSLARKITNKDFYVLVMNDLSPRVKGESAKELVKIGRQATPNLISILNDQKKGIIAHVILSEIWKESWPETKSNYILYDKDVEILMLSGLKMYVNQNDNVQATPKDLEENKEKWKKFTEV